MWKITSCKIAKGIHLEALEKEINKYIKEGYTPSGEIQYFPPIRETDGPGVYVKSMYKYVFPRDDN